MADAGTVLRAWLLATPSVTSKLGTNAAGSIYVGDLREGFDPLLGMAIQIVNTGGNSDPEPLGRDTVSMQVRVWAGVDEYLKARTLYDAIQAELHGTTNKTIAGKGYVMTCQSSVSGQDVTDQVTGWATVLAKYQIMLRDI